MSVSIGRRALTAALLAAALGSLVLAVPPLRGVAREIGRLSPGWLVLAVVLELASCACYVIVFRLFFGPVERRAARRLAWVEEGSGALLPGGGVGALAVGGLLLRRAGMSTRSVVRRSSGLFFLTSAVNVGVMVAAGTLLATRAATGPHDVARAAAPALAGVAVVAATLAIPALFRRRRRAPHWAHDLVDGIGAALDALRRPNWRLLGAAGYLGFDIAVLWATFAAAGRPLPAAPLALAYIVGYLANLIPAPGGIGVLEGGLAGALIAYGAPATQAAAAVIVYHAIAFWIPSVGGLAAYALLRRQLAADEAIAPSDSLHAAGVRAPGDLPRLRSDRPCGATPKGSPIPTASRCAGAEGHRRPRAAESGALA